MVDKIIKIVSETLETPVDEATSQDNCEKWNSLQHLNIIVALEEVFGVLFKPEDMAKMKSIKKIEQILANYIN